MDKGSILIALALIITVLAASFTIGAYIYNVTGADPHYSREFGSDLTMMMSGASTLTGPDSIQDYLNRVWTHTKEVFAGQDNQTVYGPWLPWETVPEDRLDFQLQWFNSMNNSLTQRQKNIDDGKYVGTGDPLQTALNQTRLELKQYGGPDWVLKPAWYKAYESFAYWSGVYIIIAWLIVVAFWAIFFKFG